MSAGRTPPSAIVAECALLWVEGPDAEGFLQGLLTNDVAAVSPGGSVPALLLSGKGRILADMRVVRDGGEAFTIVAEPAQAERISALLDEYHFSEDIEIVGPEPFALVSVSGALPDLPDGLADIVLPGAIPRTIDLVAGDGPALVAALGLPVAPRDTFEVLRVEAGVPRYGVDMGEGSLVQEAGLERTAVSFDKGCYLGQETVARAQHRGHVNRLLRGLRLTQPAAAGAAVRSGEKEVGRVTSVATSPRLGPIALATLRREVAPGAEVHVEGAGPPARVVGLPFADEG